MRWKVSLFDENKKIGKANMLFNYAGFLFNGRSVEMCDAVSSRLGFQIHVSSFP